LRRAFLAFVLALTASTAGAATAFGKPADIPTPYIPSTNLAVEEMLRLAAVTADDLVVDLGSGDGRIVISAARDYGARGLGIDIDPELVKLATDNARAAGVADRVTFRQGDALKAEISDATVVTLYLLPGLVEKLKPRLLAGLKPGTRIVAHDFGFAEWQPDRTVNISKTFYLYVVPARVGGKWRLQAELPGGPVEYDFELEQSYQRLRGGARVAGGYLPAFEARLDGDRVGFVLVDNNTSHHFEGRVSGLSMEGTVRSGSGRERVTNRWRAVRVLKGAEGS
jgi:SAM-dependent methyltransferase